MYCWDNLEFQYFGMGCWRQKSVLLKSYQKLFPSVSWEPLKVPWCFICQTKSPHVEIKWLKGYCIPSIFMKNIPNQSCSSNRWTPCRIFPRVFGTGAIAIHPPQGRSPSTSHSPLVLMLLCPHCQTDRRPTSPPELSNSNSQIGIDDLSPSVEFADR